MPERVRDPDVESFLALLAARRARATVDAYGRDLAAFVAWLGREPASATPDELERWIAEGRANGLSAATLARRTAALRSFFRHLQLIGRTAENPAAANAPPRRTRRLTRTIPPAVAKHLEVAA